MGFFDSDDAGCYSGMFDLNRDGKVTWFEKSIALQMNDDDIERLSDDRYAWREYCEDGLEYGLDPENYETEEEYEDALLDAQCALIEEEERAKAAQSKSPPVANQAAAVEKKVNIEDYPNKRRYLAAHMLANDFFILESQKSKKGRQDRYHFILEKADQIPAANYLSHNGEFLYAQAIKDHFELPCSLPDEDEKREMDFFDILKKLAKRDISLSFEIWSWCIDTFLPYAQYDQFSRYHLGVSVIDSVYLYPPEHAVALAHYMSDTPGFCDKVMTVDKEMLCDSLSRLITTAITETLYKTAETLFKLEIERVEGQWKRVNSLMNGVLLWTLNDQELESAEFIRDKLLPLVKVIEDGMVQDEIPEWEKTITEHIESVESRSEKYAFTRKNAWRKSVPNNGPYGVDPCDYDTEQEYMQALREEEPDWQTWCKNREYTILRAKDVEKREEPPAEPAQRQEDTDDQTIYHYCGVLLPFSSRPYSYRIEDKAVQIGDTVIVSVGEEEMKGTVVSIGQYSRLGAPYPVEKTKFILRKVEDAEASSR